jgi:lipopolysaccharide transport system ATP-binding protein
VQAAGNTVDTVDAYLRHTNPLEQVRIEREQAEARGAQAEAAAGGASENRWGSREIEIERVVLLDRHGHETSVFNTGDPLTVRMCYHAHQPITEPVFGLAIHHANGFHINGPNTRFGGLTLGTVQGRGYVDYMVNELPLLQGQYVLTAAVYDTTMTHGYDHHERMYSFVVHTRAIAERWGSVYIPARWQVHSA